ncbi:MAG: RNA-binding transcriptional accessory protein [Rhodospirillales bacterium]|nr:RNA-binding transcriptional accessory protein [Rhodospirillales bacterium]
MLINKIISVEINASIKQVDATVNLLDEGSTVPFIARYRKEATGGLDDTQLRFLDNRLRYLRELEERKTSVVHSITEQGKMTEALTQSIAQADTKARLEDLYLPFKKKRRTKAQIAREAGLQALADKLLGQPQTVPENEAASFVDEEKGIADTKAALDGAKQILMEEFSEDAELTGSLREYLWENGLLVSKVIEGKEAEGSKFSDYFDFSEAIKKIPSHRALALFRGRNEDILRLSLELPESLGEGVCEKRVAGYFAITDQGRPADQWLLEVASWTWRIKISLRLDVDLMGRVRESAEEEAIRVFGENLRDLLLAAPAGPLAVIGLDPGIRTGVKVTALDQTGKLLETATIYPHEPRRQWDESIALLAAMVKRHGVKLISIGNGTASRETDKLVGDLGKRHPELKFSSIIVSEAGASVYSASALAAKEFPELDVSLRGAVSIARRLQDPLAELVKIDPKSIGVGQYQHDVSELKLERALDGVVEDCVNGVGVDLNTASAPLLARVAGLGENLAENIVVFRETNGAFKNRKTLKDVPRLGPKAFEQAAGFLRVNDGDNPIDRSAVHPEAYPVVKKIVKDTGIKVDELLGNAQAIAGINPENFVDEKFGLPTVKDILKELEKPGRDPRPEFKTASFKENVNTMADLEVGMLLEGVVSNVVNFGAFVDIGVHQDGLVHISQLADKFVDDPRKIVKAGDVVKVKVVEVDIGRKRIALTMKLKEKIRQNTDVQEKTSKVQQNRVKKENNKSKNNIGENGGALADALNKAGIKR